MKVDYDCLIDFHGHSCPGLAMGYRMAQAAMDHLSVTSAKDEELVAIVENDACGVDAVQFLTGCTFGKGNLIFKDYGKQVYTFYDRNTRKGVRVSLNEGNIPQAARAGAEKFKEWLLNADENEIIKLQEVSIEEPEPARIFKSTICDSCGEMVMEPRVRHIGDNNFCIPCAEKKGNTG